MTTEPATTEITEQNDMLIGPYRRPRNLESKDPRSIHNDETARKLGFRGGTIAGSFHMEQFPPLLLRAFGERWFERGSLSCYFRNATMDNEAVRAMVQTPPASTRGAGVQSAEGDVQVNVSMERDDGMQVLEGTASAGSPAEPSMLRRKLTEPREAGELRILSKLAPGDDLGTVTTRLTSEIAAPRLSVCTEPLPWYSGASPWGGAICNPGMTVTLMFNARQPRAQGDIVGLFGAIEVAQINGPLFVDRDYDVSGKIVALGTTPKTEYAWYETVAREPGSGNDVASMLMMLRFMKASSALWAE
jgi:hypothetical protein